MSKKVPSRKGPTSVPCPSCNKPVAWSPESLWRPFCSERCRLIDLGDWLDEGHRISEPLENYSEEDSSL